MFGIELPFGNKEITNYKLTTKNVKKFIYKNFNQLNSFALETIK